MEQQDNSIRSWWERLSPKKKIAIILTPIIIALVAWYSTTETFKQEQARREAAQARREAAELKAQKENAAEMGRAIGGALFDKAAEKSMDALKKGASKLGGLLE